MKFPREVWPSANKQTNTFGSKRIVVDNQEEFNSWVNAHNGRMNCFTSVYDYKEYMELVRATMGGGNKKTIAINSKQIKKELGCTVKISSDLLNSTK